MLPEAGIAVPSQKCFVLYLETVKLLYTLVDAIKPFPGDHLQRASKFASNFHVEPVPKSTIPTLPA